jgi:hypothetical protein
MADWFGLHYYLPSFFSLYIANGPRNKKAMTSLMDTKRDAMVKSFVREADI